MHCLYVLHLISIIVTYKNLDAGTHGAANFHLYIGEDILLNSSKSLPAVYPTSLTSVQTTNLHCYYSHSRPRSRYATLCTPHSKFPADPYQSIPATHNQNKRPHYTRADKTRVVIRLMGIHNQLGIRCNGQRGLKNGAQTLDQNLHQLPASPPP